MALHNLFLVPEHDSDRTRRFMAFPDRSCFDVLRRLDLPVARLLLGLFQDGSACGLLMSLPPGRKTTASRLIVDLLTAAAEAIDPCSSGEVATKPAARLSY